jgi:DNA-binding SARP family transcriptional activator/predicted ATPase
VDYVKAKLFGDFQASYNGREIRFPYNKVEALFIYLLINRRANRNHLACLLWGEKCDETARKNLRNAVYIIKKNTRMDIFSSSCNSVVAFNPEVAIETDVDAFMHSEEEMDRYTGEFIKGFTIKDSEGFESWMLDTRENLRAIYWDRLGKRLQNAIRDRDYEKAEHYSRLLIREDEYNEEAYRYLIESFYYRGKFSRAIEAYNEIASRLYKELSIKPEAETVKIYREVRKKISERKTVKTTEGFFYGRQDEISFLENNYLDFLRNGKEARSIVIKGEMGIGRTSLKNKFMEMVRPEDALMLGVDCREFEIENTLKPWRKMILKLWEAAKIADREASGMLLRIINSLLPESGPVRETAKPSGTLGPEVASELIAGFTGEMSFGKKVVLVFDDLQWMDAASLSILTNMLFDLPEEKFLFVLTCRDDHNLEVEKFLTVAVRYGKLRILELPRFDMKEVGCFFKKAMPGYSLKKESLLKIYKETEGTPFFLQEYLGLLKRNMNMDTMTSKMKDVLKSRFMGLSGESMDIAEICSIFDHEIPVPILEGMVSRDPLEIVNILKELEQKQILKELRGEHAGFKFTHRKLREFIYMNLSEAKKKILHHKAGKVIEKALEHKRADINAYHRLVYHFANAGSSWDLLKYKIKILNAHLNFSHELFPVLEYSEGACSRMYLDDKNTVKKFKEIEALLEKAGDETLNGKEYLELKASYLHMVGRYWIRVGQYENGVRSIEQMMELSKELEDRNFYLLEGYKQMIYYCIQTNNSADMRVYVSRGTELAMKCSNSKELAVFFRLKALYKKMTGRYAEAERLLWESIRRLSADKGDEVQYAPAIAAAYNYIGDIRKSEGSYSEALEHYTKAIEICEQRNILTSLAIFSVNAGEAAYNTRDFQRAKQYFNAALDIYKHFKFTWGKSIAESFMCLICFDEYNYKNTLKYLLKAEQDSKRLKNPKEIGMVYKTKAELRIRIGQDSGQWTFLKDFLNKNLEYYVHQAVEYFSLSKDVYEIRQLKRLPGGGD